MKPANAKTTVNAAGGPMVVVFTLPHSAGDLIRLFS
jgi:hypothetical protein